MPSNIVETPSQGDAISAPLDADLRNANSVRVPFQSVGNRLKFLENFYDAIKAWALGGTVAPAGAVTIDNSVDVPNNLLSALVFSGRRRFRVATPTGDTTYSASSAVDVILIDRVNLAVGTTTITISTTGYSTGDLLMVSLQSISASKDVVLSYTGGPINVPDDFTGFYLFMRVSGGWYILGKGEL